MVRTASDRRVGFWVGSLAAAVVVVLTLSGQISRFLEADYPDLALVFDPLNTEARINSITRLLNGDTSQATAADSVVDIGAGLAFAPGDARLYSLWAESELRLARSDLAFNLFSTALQLSKTELQALQRMFVHSAEKADFADAISYLDLLLRRWPEKYGPILPIIPAILNQEAGYDAMLAELRQQPPWRGRLLADLSKDPRSAEAGYRLLLDLQGSNAKVDSSEINAVVAGLLNAKLYSLAYRTFLLSLNDEERAVSGYIYNGQFSLPPSQKPFGWRATPKPGVEISVGPGEGYKSGARIRFLNKPVKHVGFQQLTLLPSGAYTLQITSSGKYLKLPKGLYWTLKCAGGSGELARLPIDEGSFTNQTAEASFSIDANTCPLQVLALESGLFANSWKYRYEGVLEVSSVLLKREGT